MNGFQMLAQAIVMQAVTDYRRAMRDLIVFPGDGSAYRMKEDCERFFRSKRFLDLSGLDGEYIIRRLEREVRKK